MRHLCTRSLLVCVNQRLLLRVPISLGPQMFLICTRREFSVSSSERHANEPRSASGLAGALAVTRLADHSGAPLFSRACRQQCATRVALKELLCTCVHTDSYRVHITLRGSRRYSGTDRDSKVRPKGLTNSGVWMNESFDTSIIDLLLKIGCYAIANPQK